MTIRASHANESQLVPQPPDGEFVRRVVKVRHDLRNPLGHIMGFSELLLDASRKRGVPTLIPDLEKMLKASDGMVLGVNRTLDPTTFTDRSNALETLDQQLRVFVTLILSTTDRCSQQSADFGEPFRTDFLRISGAAEKLLTLLPALQSLRSPSTSGKPADGARSADDAPLPSAIFQVATPLRSWKDGAILIVDPETACRNALSQTLASHGYTVLTAPNAGEAQATIQGQPIDLILLDLELPANGARSFLQSLREEHAARQIPILTLCSTTTIDEAIALLALGADDFIPKPVDSAVLMARARGALARKRGHDQERAYLQRLQGEQERSERLLSNLVPLSIGRRLKQGEKLIVDEFTQTSIVWARVSNFSRLATRFSSGQLINTMNNLFARFDLLAEAQGLERSRTQIDSYLAVSGVPLTRNDHARAAASVALGMKQEVKRLRSQDIDLPLQIVLSCGPLTAGLVGARHFTYDFWGPALDQAQELLVQAERCPEEAVVTDRASYEKLRNEFKIQPKTVEGTTTRGTIYLLSRSET